MNKKFRILAVALSLSLCVGLLAACGSNNGGTTNDTTGNNTTSDNTANNNTDDTTGDTLSINTVAKVTAINEDGSLELQVYSGSGNIADFAAVDFSAYTATESTDSITVSDESVLYAAEDGSLVPAKLDAIAVGDMLVISQDIDTNELTQVVLYAAAEDTGDSTGTDGSDASADGTESTDGTDVADSADTSSSTDTAA